MLTPVDREMDHPNIRYNLDLLEGNADLSEFARIIKSVRKVRRTRVRDGMMLEDIDIVNVDLFSQDRTIQLKTAVVDFDLTGYIKIDSENILWELRSDGDFQSLAGSKALGISLKSVNDGDGASNRDIGFMAMNNAFNTLWTSHPNENRDDIESALQTIRLMLFETAKFRWSFFEVYRNIERKVLLRVPAWMMILANNWDIISVVARSQLPMHKFFPQDLDPAVCTIVVTLMFSTLG
uniref:uncharacterized protein LOC122582506 n=1 Tax=Erigeron canadensis TaxID=72917 RepID=UPI001CB956D6|nr:uncharacterized protein LOC122582506 [Erigeron canadensis]XP_043610846.1 uncharacterized protein LOC122582506 [Erigeron canadensis]